MEGGSGSTSRTTLEVVNEQLSSLSFNEEEGPLISYNPEKDPRTIARKYQIDLCAKALKENVIVCLGTGCGKTHIAVLLIYEMRHLIKKPQKNICIFLAPTVALVQQQAKVLEKSIDFKVGTYCGSTSNLKDRYNWEKELEEYEVLVMTPQILLHNLSHCFIKIELIALLIFDECHYAQVESNHPYAEIMKIFYKVDAAKLPRIFGMTASPKLGKGGSIDSLEGLLRAKVYSVKEKDELEHFVTSPKVNVYYYGSSENGCTSPYLVYTRKLEEIKHQIISELRMNTLNQNVLMTSKKMIKKRHCDLVFCLENLGLWGALQASHIALKSNCFEETVQEERSSDDTVQEQRSSNDNICNNYLVKGSSILASACTSDGKKPDISCVDGLEEPFFSKKLSRLVDILSNFRLQPNMKCIVFVNRIIIARSLSFILTNLKILHLWKCGFLVGIHSGVVSRKNTDIILEKFRSGELNLLVATKVGEEGLDIQTCCLVVRFDLPETVASFIQSRGRARMPQSEYAFLVDRGNLRELDLIEHFKRDEDQMNNEISYRKSHASPINFEEKTYKVGVTGATLSAVSSISMLYHYCAKLPHDEYYNPKPDLFFYDEADGVVCNIILPANAPIYQIAGAPQSSREEAKRDACLKACKELHELGALTDYLLPEKGDEFEEESEDLSNSDSCDDDEDARVELHEMLVPAALRKSWKDVEDFTYFFSYYIMFSPSPADRVYRKFGLFVKEPLPEEAGNMRLDLSLARGRMVATKLIPSGTIRFDRVDIASAEKFQRMFLKVILDRYIYISDYVSLEDNDMCASSSSTFYLLLPVTLLESDKISVDWMIINRCLSSPIFRPDNYLNDDVSHHNKDLFLYGGRRSIHDILNSLVYVPCKDTFFFISDFYPEKNGYSSYKDSKCHVEHYEEVFDIHLAYPRQPLLKAKQLFVLDNLLRKKKNSEEWREKEEHFIELPPEICQLKVIGFSKDFGNSLSLLLSIMHRLEGFLVAVELKDKLFASFPEAAEVSVVRILEALTTERCCEQFSLERLEVLGDAFLKFAVGRHLFLKHDSFDEGQLTRKRSNVVNNANLHKLAIRNKLQVYIRDRSFDPTLFFTFGHPCPNKCNKESEKALHSRCSGKNSGGDLLVTCDKCHLWLHKKIIADVVEALIGAFIVDSGFKAATAFLNWIGIQVDFAPSHIQNICSASAKFIALADEIDVNALENLLGYKFHHKGLLIEAFLHPSYSNHLGGCYQRLEFLGDAVLDYLITSYLYSVYPDLKPGQLTDLRSASVNNISFADVAGRLTFQKFLLCDSTPLRESVTEYLDSLAISTSEEKHVEEKTCPKVLGDLVESCMGAIYLDTGFDLSRSWAIVLSLLDPIVSLSKLHINPLRDLRELCQSHSWELQFSSFIKDGKFSVEAKVDERKVSVTAIATNTSKKAAEKTAGRQVLEYLKAQGYVSKSKTLEQVLRTCEIGEAKLIGYDEMASSQTTESGKLKVQEWGKIDSKKDVYSRTVGYPSFPQLASESVVARSNDNKIDSLAIHSSNSCGADSRGTELSGSGSAKSRLYELCATNLWNPPIFECCGESGQSHLKEFIYKVVLDMDDFPNETMEFYGGSRTRKKDAAEHAAEGALWYLKQQGYLWIKKRDKSIYYSAE